MIITDNGDGSADEFILSASKAKYVKISAALSSANKGYTIKEFEVYRPAVTKVEFSDALPESFFLFQNYPNPFNPVTNFGFRIADFGFVTLKVYDVIGNEVAVLVNEENEPGEYKIQFNAANLSSGVYFYKLTAGKFIQTKKMILLK